MQIQYIGPHADGVDVPLPDGSTRHVPAGGVLDTISEHAASLLEQKSNWQAATAAEPKEKKAGGKSAGADNAPDGGLTEEVPGVDR